MRLKAITLKGFKSFPGRTRLEFGEGTSVIVGPNGSGKSNITDAVLWALGEQSPLAVRGQTMQDVIFAGGHGTKSRSAAEVEVVIDNSDARLHSEFSELSIRRRLDRSGEGSYYINGARCRLVDVVETLSDSGLGKEMHSVISQGRVEEIVLSKPGDRTALIEEAAGLSKHRKRRHRAELKLRRTQENLARALDVEREARSHLRPLKRQAEAAELHARLEHRTLELRAELVGDALRIVRGELREVERAADAARGRRDELDAELREVAHRREQTEREFTEHGRGREHLSSRVLAARSAAERISLRLESAGAATESVGARLARSRKALEALTEAGEASGGGRLGELEAELERLEGGGARLPDELADSERGRQDAERSAAELEQRIEAESAKLEQAERAAAEARERSRLAAERAEAATRERAKLEIELDSIAERLRLLGASEGPSLLDRIDVEDGFERALAGALGGRLNAIVVRDLEQGARAIEDAGRDGARVLVERCGPAAETAPPCPGADRLLDHVRPDPEVCGLLERLLAGAWVVDRITDVPEEFEGLAVTPAGIAYHGLLGELMRLPAGGAQRALAERGRHAQIECELERSGETSERASADGDRAAAALREAEEERDAAETRLRDLRWRREEALEDARRTAWLIEQRRRLGSEADDPRRAQLAGEIAAERRLAERLEREAAQHAARRRRLEATVEYERVLLPCAERMIGVLGAALAAAEEHRAALEGELAAGEAVGEEAAAELRKLAQAEYELQARLREASEALTEDEVRVAQVREHEGATSSELREISGRLGCEIGAAEEPLTDEARAEIEVKLERLARRRERLGPVNPLAKPEYEQARAHVEELESQRKDLEEALAELRSLIQETDRRIRDSFEQTFEATARNFEDVVERLFPGGRGRLRLVAPLRPQPVLGGGEVEEGGEEASDEAGGAGSTARETRRDETPGIEIEVTPAGKSTKRLSLLSGGEKSLVALAFMFAVFLARPCPFYILDEVEAALDDINIDRFLGLIRAYADRAQFVIVTHQRRTLEVADTLYGVSMGGDGITKVVSRRLEPDGPPARPGPEAGEPEERLTEAA